MTLLIQIAGWMLITLAAVHVIFPLYFDWKADLDDLRLINRQMMEVHTFFVALLVFLMGLLCVSSATQLITTALGRRICLGLAVFWGARLLAQLFWYSPKLWRGKPFETSVHIGLTALWTALTVLYGWAGTR